MICKDTNSKAIHNLSWLLETCYWLFMICKDTNSKAIHNDIMVKAFQDEVVYDMQRY